MSKEIRSNEWLEWIQSIVIALIIALIIKFFLFDFIEVEGNSMYPTLHDEDRLIVNKIGYLINEPDYGDIVIFRYPTNPSINFIKRVIGKEGDTIEIKDHSLYRNDKKIIESYIDEDDMKPFPKVVVPEDSYFVLGDNRNNSRDSRASDVGFLNKEEIRGEAIIRLWPLHSIDILN